MTYASTFFIFGVDLRPESVILECMNSKDRMKEWKKLPRNTIPWETFKRLTSQFGMKKGIEKAKEIIEKQG